MGSKKSALASKAWNLLRLALFWARKGDVFKRGFMDYLLPSHAKTLRAAPRYSIHYGEREFSFDETPIFHFKTHRSSSMRFRCLPHIPCINPSTDVDFDDDSNGSVGYGRYDANGLFRRDMNEEEEDGERYGGGCLDGGDEAIDTKADEFIARFYKEMKLQRQISYLEYNEMMHRSVS